MDSDEMLISVVVPVFNEELTIGNVIERLTAVMQKIGSKYEIIVVDDCSTDRSLDISKSQSAKVFSLKKHMGKGYALRAGFAKAKGEIITTIDSDGSHRPEELPQLLIPLLQNKADLIIGSRYLSQKSVATKKLNAVGVRLFNSLIKILTRAEVSDSQSGYRVMKSVVLRNMRLKSSEYEIESEMLVKTARQGFRIREVPISFEQRTYGTSRLDPVVDGFKILLSIILAYMTGGRR
ncbi:MAG: glycosyltransferase family 2 protein [Candidatus Bathyarchaeota archaeon]|nr:MAG: glycosyltransferase family 2 protein [Candidatus Bathyarchaeota archaeon]